MAAMTAQPFDAARVDPFEPPGVAWSRVSGRLAVARRLTLCPVLTVLAAGFVLAASFTGLTWWYLPAAGLALTTVWAWWLIGRQVRAIGYAEQEDDLLVRRGIMMYQIVVVPYGRLQYVEVEAGPVDRVLGISRVQLHTASASTDASIPGLPPGEAARLRDRLTERGEARLAGL
jgi:membrane protein YdbS with pleckstrin-like domain